MRVNANDIRVGNVVEHNSKLWIVLKTQHVQPGKGGAFIQAEMKGILDGTKLNERFRSSEAIERVYLDEAEYQFLYREGDELHFMDQATFEQIQLPAGVVGEGAQFLDSGMLVTICSYNGAPITVSLPKTVTLEIVEAEPVVKGQTAASSYKPAILSNGVKIMVPQHIEAGIKIVINTEDASYVERAK
jgi:elongation factor P